MAMAMDKVEEELLQLLDFIDIFFQLETFYLDLCFFPLSLPFLGTDLFD